MFSSFEYPNTLNHTARRRLAFHRRLTRVCGRARVRGGNGMGTRARRFQTFDRESAAVTTAARRKSSPNLQRIAGA